MVEEEKKESFIYTSGNYYEYDEIKRESFPVPPRNLRRANSEPSDLGSNQQRRLLVEDHYRIEENTKILLPGVPSQDEDWARDTHDFFNLIVLVSTVLSLIQKSIFFNFRCLESIPANFFPKFVHYMTYYETL